LNKKPKPKRKEERKKNEAIKGPDPPQTNPRDDPLKSLEESFTKRQPEKFVIFFYHHRNISPPFSIETAFSLSLSLSERMSP
jgi:hypothetical protein